MAVFRGEGAFLSLKRYGQVFRILAKYGFGDLLARLRGRYRRTWIERVFHKRLEELERFTTPERVRMAFEELGPTFIKLGQILSVRPDLLPPQFIAEFTKFQDSVPPFPFQDVRRIIETQLGRPIPELFSSFGEDSIAAASLAQVHPATTKDGQDVIVKVLRPGIEKIIETDIRILRHLAGVAERRIAEAQLYEPSRIVKEFARTVRRELDFVREGRNIDRFRRHFADDPTVHIPSVYWDLSAPQVLTMERIRGIKITNLSEIAAAGLDRRTIAINGADLIFKEVFDFHFFHADPHPGNIFVLPGNVIAPVDYGMVGSLDTEIAEHMGIMLTAIVDKDVEALADGLLAVGAAPRPLDRAAFKLELSDFLERYYDVPLQQLSFQALMEELIGITRQYHLRLPSELILMAKALITNEGVGRTLYPEFNMIEHSRPYAKKLLMRRLDPWRKLRKLARILGDTESLFEHLAPDLSEILGKVKNDKLTIGFRHEGLEELTTELDRSTNRLSFAIVIGSLIIGSSFVTQLGKGPFLWGFPLLGLIGYLVAALLGLWLVVGIMRSGRL